MSTEQRGLWPWVTRGVAVALALFQLYTAGFGSLPDLQQRAVHVTLGFVLTVLVTGRAKRPHEDVSVPWWDIILILIIIASGVNVYFSYERFFTYLGESNILDLFLGAGIILIALEAGRRVVGWVFPILVVLALLYIFLGRYLPGQWQFPGLRFEHLIQVLYQTGQGVWGYVTGVSATILAVFLIFGSILLYTGGGQTFIDLATLIAGRWRGGPALVAVIASGLFGTISGSAVANCAAVGGFTIPMMKKLGYSQEFAGGVEAAASSGGQIMPPIMGAGAFIMAELLGISYLRIVVAAIIPALLYYVAVFAAVRFEALRRGLSSVPREQMRSAREIFTWARFAPLVLPIAALLYLLAIGYSIELCAFYACILSIVLFVFSNFRPKQMVERLKTMLTAVEKGAIAITGIVSLVVCANIVIALINVSGIGIKFSAMIVDIGSSSVLVALAVGAGVCLILGMALPTTAAYLLTATIMSPALIGLEVRPIAAHLMLFYYAVISAITPPVCVACFTAAAIARTSWVKTSLVAMRLGVVAYFIPILFIYEPTLLMIGTPGEILVTLISAILGAIVLGAALFGYLTVQLNVIARVIFLGSAVLFFIPNWQMHLIAVAVVAIAIVGQRFSMTFRRARV